MKGLPIQQGRPRRAVPPLARIRHCVGEEPRIRARASIHRLPGTLQTQGVRMHCPVGTSFPEATRTSGLGLVSICGGEDACGRCLAPVVEGAAPQPTGAERDQLSDAQIAAGARLALVSRVQRQRAAEIAPHVLHLDLMLLSDFTDRFASALYLPDPAQPAA